MGVDRNGQYPSVVKMFVVMIIVYPLFLWFSIKNRDYLPVFLYLFRGLVFCVRCNPWD